MSKHRVIDSTDVQLVFIVPLSEVAHHTRGQVGETRAAADDGHDDRLPEHGEAVVTEGALVVHRVQIPAIILALEHVHALLEDLREKHGEKLSQWTPCETR